MSEDRSNSGITLGFQRRTWHLSLDGNTLAWMDIHGDGTMLVAGKLTKEENKYTVKGMRVINPIGPL